MNNKCIPYILIISLIVTAIGLITGKFIFLFLILPLGFGLFKGNSSKKKNHDDHRKLGH